jgi:hypothetical protein
MKCHEGPQSWIDSLAEPKNWKEGIRYGIAGVKLDLSL